MALIGADLAKKYHKTQVVQGVSFALQQGECLGVLGDNGSGKSTLMSIVAGMQPADGGTLLLDGAPISKQARRRIGYVPQVPILMEALTVRENIALWQSIYQMPVTDALPASIPDCLDIPTLLPKRVARLSGGMKKKVSIAIALMHQPDYLVLDEACAALDAKTVGGMVQYLKSATQMGVIYSSHNIQEVAWLCHRVMVLRKGQVSYESPVIECYDAATVASLYQNF